MHEGRVAATLYFWLFYQIHRSGFFSEKSPNPADRIKFYNFNFLPRYNPDNDRTVSASQTWCLTIPSHPLGSQYVKLLIDHRLFDYLIPSSLSVSRKYAKMLIAHSCLIIPCHSLYVSPELSIEFGLFLLTEGHTVRRHSAQSESSVQMRQH